jgi:hypothetical protein
MPQRLLVDLSEGMPWPLDRSVLEELRWYLEDYLRVPFAVYEDRGSRVAARLPSWGRAMFESVLGAGRPRTPTCGRASLAMWSWCSARRHLSFSRCPGS